MSSTVPLVQRMPLFPFLEISALSFGPKSFSLKMKFSHHRSLPQVILTLRDVMMEEDHQDQCRVRGRFGINLFVIK